MNIWEVFYLAFSNIDNKLPWMAKVKRPSIEMPLSKWTICTRMVGAKATHIVASQDSTAKVSEIRLLVLKEARWISIVLPLKNHGLFSPKWNIFIALLPSRAQGSRLVGRKIVKTRGSWQLQGNHVSYTQQDSCTYEFTAVRKVCTGHVQDQVRQNLVWRGKLGTESHPSLKSCL